MGWIQIKEQSPTLEDCGKLFLCCLETSTSYDYEVLEWWNPLNEGEVSEDKDDDPHFLFPYKMYHREVIAWMPFEEFEEQKEETWTRWCSFCEEMSTFSETNTYGSCQCS